MSDERRRLLARAANWLAIAGLVGYAVYFSTAGAHAGDAHAYWAANPADPYTTGVNEPDAYLYSPAFLQALVPLKVLPWEEFWIAWTVINLAVLAWTVGPIIGVLVLLPGAYSPVWVNLWYGNIGILMAAALVLAFRHPAAWSFLILTKVTPGVGILWFVGRRQWRYLLAAVVITVAIAGISFALAPAAWLEWPTHLAGTSADILDLPPLWLRLAVAAGLALAGGILAAPWTVPLAALIGQPVFWFTGFAMLLAWVGLLRRKERPRHSLYTNVPIRPWRKWRDFRAIRAVHRRT